MSPAALLVLVALAGLAWRGAAFLSGALAWVLVAVMALSLAVGVAVPAPVVVLAVSAWLASQVVSRIRTGRYRSGLLRRVAG